MMPENGPGRMNSEGESCHSGKVHLPFAAAAATAGAPQATQCADRFPLIKNLGEALEGLLARHLATHRNCQVEKSSVTPLEGTHGIQPPFLSSKGSIPEAGEARGASCPLPARCRLTQARPLANGRGLPGWDRPCHGLALVGKVRVPRTTTTPAKDAS